MIRPAVLLTTVALMACDELPSALFETEATQPADQPADFRVTAQQASWGGLSPLHDFMYSWTIGSASRVSVSRLGDPEEVVWEVVAASGSGIRTGLQHGQVPTGAEATVQTAVVPLTPGEPDSYRVTVTLRGDGRTASADFTP